MRTVNTQKSESKKIKNLRLAVLMGWLLLLFYNFHRYIFKFNSENTSPTYTNTPTSWKVGKYVVLGFIGLFYYLNTSWGNKITKRTLPLILALGITSIYNIFNLYYFKSVSFDETGYVFYLVLLLPYLLSRYSINDLNINYYVWIKRSAIVLFISNLFVILNYLFRGVLPALAYEGSLVRFGAYWDDPNGFGIICVFFFYYFYKKRNYILAICSIICIVLTFSFSCYILLIVISVYYFLFEKRMILPLIIALCILFIVFMSYSDKILDLYTLKQGSIEGHLHNEFKLNLLNGSFYETQFSENWYVSFFYNYFPFSPIILILFLSSIFVYSLKNWKTKKNAICFFLLIVLGSNFFPLLYIFPINFLIVILYLDIFRGSKSKIS